MKYFVGSYEEAKHYILKYLMLLEPLSISAVINVLLNTMSIVARQYGLSQSVSEADKEWQMKLGVALYTKYLNEMISEEQPPRRKQTFGLKCISDLEAKAIEKTIEKELLKFVSELSHETALNFLAGLSAEWIRTCSEEAIRQHRVFIMDGLEKRVHNDRDLSQILFDWIIWTIHY